MKRLTPRGRGIGKILGLTILLSLGITAWGCISLLMTKEDVQKMNEGLKKQVWVVRRNIMPPHTIQNDAPIFHKGDRVRIWVISGIAWIKVKAFHARERREQAQGRTAIFLFQEDLENDLDKAGAGPDSVNREEYIRYRVHIAIREMFQPIKSGVK